jgi:hypothetical protein
MNGALAMCLHKIQPKKSRNQPASQHTNKHESVLQKPWHQMLRIKKKKKKPPDGVPNSTGWKENFYS